MGEEKIAFAFVSVPAPAHAYAHPQKSSHMPVQLITCLIRVNKRLYSLDAHLNLL